MRSNFEKEWDEFFGIRTITLTDLQKLIFRYSKINGRCLKFIPSKQKSDCEENKLYYLNDLDSYVSVIPC